MFHPNPRVPGIALHPVETIKSITSIRPVETIKSAHPIEAVKTVVEVVTFLTRDLSCSMTGHDVVRTEDGGVLCLHCLKRCTVERDRVRWVA